MSIVSIVLLGALGLKVFWNLTLPYSLRRAARKVNDGEQGTSLMLSVEWLLLALIAGSAGLSSGDSWLDDPKRVSLISLGLILGSYLHFGLASVTLGAFDSRNRPAK